MMMYVVLAVATFILMGCNSQLENYVREAISKSSSEFTVVVDNMNPIYMAGETLEFPIYKKSNGEESITLQFAEDGTTFSNVATYPANTSSISWTIPAVSASQARLRVLVLSSAGLREFISPAFRIFSKIEFFSGKRALSGSADGIASHARFKTIEGLVKVGSALYVADVEKIRKIDMSTPGNFVVTTFVGKSGQVGFSDGVGQQALFKSIRGLATDGTDIYATDTNHVIRKIEVGTQTVTTIAGQPEVTGSADGAGSAASFSSPFGIVYMGGELYVADQGNHRIRKVTLAGVVTTIAGSTNGFLNHLTNPLSARFSNPLGITGDGTSLYIADSSNQLIRKINLVTGETSTLAGKQGTFGWGNKLGIEASFSSPRHLVYSGGYVYVSDFNSHAVRRVDAASGMTTNFLGTSGEGTDGDGSGSNAKFNSPSGIAVGGADEMFLASYGNSKIHQITISSANAVGIAGPSTADVLSARGTPAARINPPYGLLKVGNILYVSETNSNTIRQINLTTSMLSWYAGNPGSVGTINGAKAAAEFNQPRGMVAVAGSIYVADSLNHSIRRIDSLGNVTTIAGLNGTSGNIPAAGTTELGSTARLNNPVDMIAIGTILYVSDYGNHKIRRIDITDPNNPTVATYAGSVAGSVDATGTSARLRNPYGLATDGSYLYVSDYGNHSLRRISLPPSSPGIVTTVAGTAGTAGLVDDIGTAALLRNPRHMVANSTDIYFGDNTHRIRRFNIATGAVATILGSSAGHFDGIGSNVRFNNVQGLVLDGNDLYAANYGSLVIQKIDLTTLTSTTIAGVTNSYGMIDGLASDYGVTYNSVLSGTDSLYLGGWETHVISKIAPDGSLSHFAGKYRDAGTVDGPLATAKLFNVVGMVQIGQEIYFSNNTTIRRINLNTNTIDTVAGTANVYGSADGIGAAARFGGLDTMATDGTYIYINDRTNHIIRRMNIATFEVTTIAGIAGSSGTTDGALGVGTLNSPTKIMYFANSIYVTDFGNHIIRKIENANSLNPILTTVAGQVGVRGHTATGVGTSVLLDEPVGIVNDGKYIYFLNTGSYILQRLDPQTLQIKTIAGKPYESGMVQGNFESGRFIDASHDMTMSPYGILIGGGSSLIRMY